MFQSDKASMLDEAIEYLKSLQLQVQVYQCYCMNALYDKLCEFYSHIQIYINFIYLSLFTAISEKLDTTNLV